LQQGIKEALEKALDSLRSEGEGTKHPLGPGWLFRFYQASFVLAGRRPPPRPPGWWEEFLREATGRERPVTDETS
jgi:hypothetical protein